MKNPLALSRLSAFLTQQSPQPDSAGPPGAVQVAEARPAPRRSMMARGAAVLGGMGGFYLLSATGHLLMVGVIVTVPLGISSTFRPKHRPRSINTEVTSAPTAPSFDLVSADVAEPTSAQLAQASTSRSTDEQSPPADAASPTAQPVASTLPPPEPVDPAAEAADSQAAEAALASALVWLAQHQEPDGRWSLSGFEKQCQGGRCGGAGNIQSDAAATGLALLPFLVAGDMSAASSRYQDAVARGMQWLLQHQRQDGDLSAEGEQRMYSHAVAGLALCQHFSLTRDPRVGAAAQSAVEFTASAQNPATGAWHYDPGGRGNTSSVAWQIMFLKAAENGGLKVDSECWSRAQRWLTSVAQGKSGGVFCYEPQRIVTPTMTCVGLLGLQYRGARVEEPTVVEGRAFLLAHPPDKEFGRDVFYWYLGSQVVRKYGELEWKPWYRRLRRDLIDSQATAGCATGTWYLGPSAPELWSVHAGRLLTTSLAAQLLASGLNRSPLPGQSADLPMAAAPNGVKSR